MAAERAERFETFTGLLRARAAELPEQDVHIQLRDALGGPVAEHLTYGQLDREARRIASCLQSMGPPAPRCCWRTPPPPAS